MPGRFRPDESEWAFCLVEFYEFIMAVSAGLDRELCGASLWIRHVSCFFDEFWRIHSLGLSINALFWTVIFSGCHENSRTVMTFGRHRIVNFNTRGIGIPSEFCLDGSR